MPQIYNFEQVVNFGDVDSGGVVYHPRYLEYYERARIDVLKKINCPFDQMIRDGIFLVVASANITYRKPLVFGDVALVSSEVLQVSGKSVVVKQQIHTQLQTENGMEQTLCSTVEIVLVCFDLKNRTSASIPEDMAQKFKDAL